ncbi:MAG TPA: hypothetical protein VNX86_04610 [Rhizomicrobium sp.]|jgi:hypothetical protein|nr:hypothetical protein [Rhizomicrobium sp.]
MSKGNYRLLEAEHRFARAMERGDEERAVDALDMKRAFGDALCVSVPPCEISFVRAAPQPSMRRAIVFVPPKKSVRAEAQRRRGRR